MRFAVLRAGARDLDAILADSDQRRPATRRGAAVGLTQLPVQEKRVQVADIYRDEIRVIAPAKHAIAAGFLGRPADAGGRISADQVVVGGPAEKGPQPGQHLAGLHRGALGQILALALSPRRLVVDQLEDVGLGDLGRAGDRPSGNVMFEDAPPLPRSFEPQRAVAALR